MANPATSPRKSRWSRPRRRRPDVVSARRARLGLFQTAHGGTLFLDEIGLLHESAQAKLLTGSGTKDYRLVPGTSLKVGDVVLVEAGDMIP